MIKKVIEIDVDQVQAMGGLDALQQSLAETESKSASLKAELRKLKEQLAQLPEGSEEYNKIAQRAGEVSDQIGDINTRIKNLGSDTKNIDAVVEGTQALSGAFTVATSASALFGNENKELEETMLKVQSAIGVTVGIQSIANALQKETALSIGLANVATKIQIGLQTAYATVVGTTTGALKALRVALVSTGVGALVVALGLLISKLTDSTESTEDLEKAQADLNDEIERSKSLYSDFSKSIEFATKAKVLQAKIAGASEKELQELERQGVKNQIQNLKEEQEQLQRDLNNKAANAETQKKIIASITANKKEQLALSRELDLADLEFQNSLAEKRREAQDKANEKRREQLELAKKELLEYQKSVNEGLNELQIATNNAEFEQRFIDIENKRSQVEQINALSEQNTQNEQAEAEARIKIAQAEADAKQASIEGYASALEKVSGIVGTQTVFGKALAISASLINTYASITGQLKAFSGVPIPGYAIAQAIATGAVGFANVSKIASVKVPRGGSGGGSTGASVGSGGGASATPQFNLVGQSSTNQLTATIAGQQNRPVQTYVVGSQVTSQQALDRNAQQASVFG